jgi:hypothetical protein
LTDESAPPRAVEGLRAALDGAAVGRSLAALAIFTAACAPLAALLFARALRRARSDGSLGYY